MRHDATQAAHRLRLDEHGPAVRRQREVHEVNDRLEQLQLDNVAQTHKLRFRRNWHYGQELVDLISLLQRNKIG